MVSSLADGTARASFVLVNKGVHWMLAIGARVDAGTLTWLALVNPTGSTIEVQFEPGVRTSFTANSQGRHPDWEKRYVVVAPSTLTRNKPAGVGPPAAPHMLMPNPLDVPAPQGLETPGDTNAIEEFFALAETQGESLPDLGSAPPPSLSEAHQEKLLEVIRKLSTETEGLFKPLAGAARLLDLEPVLGPDGYYWLAKICLADGTGLAFARITGGPPEVAALAFGLHMEKPAPPPWAPNALLELSQKISPAAEGDEAGEPVPPPAPVPGPHRLVWQECLESASPFFPFLESGTGEDRVWIDRGGTRHKTISSETGGI